MSTKSLDGSEFVNSLLAAELALVGRPWRVMLQCIDESQNMRKFYEVTGEGRGVCNFRHGRIGASGRNSGAKTYFEAMKQVERKMAKGYDYHPSTLIETSMGDLACPTSAPFVRSGEMPLSVAKVAGFIDHAVPAVDVRPVPPLKPKRKARPKPKIKSAPSLSKEEQEKRHLQSRLRMRKRKAAW